MNQPEIEFYKRLTEFVPTAPTEGSPVEERFKAVPDYKIPVSPKNLFTHQEIHPIVLDLSLLKAFGEEWYYWEVPTLWKSIHDEFKSKVSESNRAKINAVRTARITTLPWDSWHVFENVVLALDGFVPRWDILQKVDLESLFVGVDILEQIRPEDYSEDVRNYIAAVFLDDDVFFTPPPLEFSQAEVSQPYYLCKDCGNEEWALHHDGICSVCSGRYDPENGLSMRPSQEAIDKKLGQNTVLRYKFDPGPEQRVWDLVARSKNEQSILKVAGPAEIGVSKLLDARDLMNIRRRQLKNQLTALKSWLNSRSS